MVSGFEISKLSNILHKASFGFSFVFNAYLIFLILTKSPKELSAYKYLLVFTSLFEITYSALEAYLVPMHWNFETTDVVLISLGDKPFSPFTLIVLNAVYWGFFGSTLSIYAVHFIYRFLAVSQNQLLQTFNSWKLLLWLLVPFAVGAFWCFIGLHLCGPAKSTTELISHKVLESFGEPIENFVYLGGTLYTISQNGVILPNYRVLLGVMSMSSSLVVSFSIIFYCGVKCYRFIMKMMESTSNVSAKSKSLQSQLFYALVIQIIIPTVLLNLPLTIFFALSFLNRGPGDYSAYLSFFITLYPVIDPLPNFFIIVPYRKAMFDCFRRGSIGPEVAVPPNSIPISRT